MTFLQPMVAWCRSYVGFKVMRSALGKPDLDEEDSYEKIQLSPSSRASISCHSFSKACARGTSAFEHGF